MFDILSNARPLKQKHGPCGGGGRCRPDFTTIFDPAIGSGRLTDPWYDAGRFIWGCDIVDAGARCHYFDECRFETFPASQGRPDLVLCNPPFNGAEGGKLYPEVFLGRILDLFGVHLPTVLFAPMGLRLNQRRKSKRWRWLRDRGRKITSIVSLPLDTFPAWSFTPRY